MLRSMLEYDGMNAPVPREGGVVDFSGLEIRDERESWLDDLDMVLWGCEGVRYPNFSFRGWGADSIVRFIRLAAESVNADENGTVSTRV